jgi:hypothetical protein
MPCVEFELMIPGFRASEDSACLRPSGYRDRLFGFFSLQNSCLQLIALSKPMLLSEPAAKSSEKN